MAIDNPDLLMYSKVSIKVDHLSPVLSTPSEQLIFTDLTTYHVMFQAVSVRQGDHLFEGRVFNCGSSSTAFSTAIPIFLYSCDSQVVGRDPTVGHEQGRTTLQGKCPSGRA